MSPNTLKAIALALVAAMSALENSGLLPHGVSSAIGGALVFGAGLYHPEPSKGGKSQ